MIQSITENGMLRTGNEFVNENEHGIGLRLNLKLRKKPKLYERKILDSDSSNYIYGNAVLEERSDE